MGERIRKGLRTLQSELPFLKELKDGACFHARRMLQTPHERDFAALRYLRPSANECFVDVGANQGQSIESILLAQPDATVVSFEATPTLGQKLARRYERYRNVRVVPKGLSDCAGHFTLFVPAYKGFVYDGLASFDREAATSWLNDERVFGFDPAKLVISEVACEIETLDAQKLAPLFIKVDVQGYEYNVLNGGRDTLRRYEPVLLLEAFKSDIRTVRLAEELGYNEYYFDGSYLRRGSPTKGPNSFLITPRRIKALCSAAEMASTACVIS